MTFCLFIFFVIFEEPIANWINAKAEELRTRAKQEEDYEQ